MKGFGFALVFTALFSCGTAGAEGRKTPITLELNVPDTAWKVQITEVYRVGEELWVVARLERSPSMMGAQMITTASDSVEVDSPPLPVKYFVMGKTWGWAGDEGLTFITSESELPEAVKGGRRIYPRQ